MLQPARHSDSPTPLHRDLGRALGYVAPYWRGLALALGLSLSTSWGISFAVAAMTGFAARALEAHPGAAPRGADRAPGCGKLALYPTADVSACEFPPALLCWCPDNLPEGDKP